MTKQLQKKTDNAFPLDKALSDYSVLKARVGKVLIAGRRRIGKEFMRMRYHTGLLINEHVRLNGDRAAYGTHAILKLEKDFHIEHSELQRYAQFAKAYPIVGGRRQSEFNLPWMHYRKLMVIPDPALRDQLTARAEKNEWNFEEVALRVSFALGKAHDDKRGGEGRGITARPWI